MEIEERKNVAWLFRFPGTSEQPRFNALFAYPTVNGLLLYQISKVPNT